MRSSSFYKEGVRPTLSSILGHLRAVQGHDKKQNFAKDFEPLCIKAMHGALQSLLAGTDLPEFDLCDDVFEVTDLLSDWVSKGPEIAVTTTKTLQLFKKAFFMQALLDNIAEGTVEEGRKDPVADLVIAHGQVVAHLADEACVQAKENTGILVSCEQALEMLTECRQDRAAPKLATLTAATEKLRKQLQTFPEGFDWHGDFDGSTWAEFKEFAVTSLKDFDSLALHAVLGQLGASIRDVCTVQDMFSNALKTSFAEVTAGQKAYVEGYTVLVEGMCFSHLESCGNPLVLKQKVNRTILDAKKEVREVEEASTFGVAQLHPLLQAQLKERTKFSAA